MTVENMELLNNIIKRCHAVSTMMVMQTELGEIDNQNLRLVDTLMDYVVCKTLDKFVDSGGTTADVAAIFNRDEEYAKTMIDLARQTPHDMRDMITAVWSQSTKNEKLKKIEHIAREPIEILGFSARVQNVLEWEKIHFVFQLLDLTITRMRKIPNLGKLSQQEIVDKLKSYGVELDYK